MNYQSKFCYCISNETLNTALHIQVEHIYRQTDGWTDRWRSIWLLDCPKLGGSVYINNPKIIIAVNKFKNEVKCYNLNFI